MANLRRWNADAIVAKVRDHLRPRLYAAAIVVANRTKALISVDGTGVRIASVPARGKRRGRRAGALVYGANPSRPGEPPHVQTGRLRASIVFEVVGMVARIGTNLLYGRYLETGAPKAHLAARPYLVRSLRETAPRIQRILTAPLGSFTNPIDIT